MESTSYRKSIIMALLISALALLWTIPAAAGFVGTISDNFNDGVINSSLWNVITSSMVSETSGKLQITMPAATAGSNFNAGLSSKFKLKGDYDIQVDYTLVTWPATDGIWLDLAGNNGTGTVQRDGATTTNGESYYSLLPTNPHNVVENRIPTADASGALRLTRIGSTATSYYLHDSNWVQIGSNTNAALQDTGIYLRAITPFGFGGEAAQITFDNFQVQYADIGYPPAVPLPGAVWLLGSGLVGLAGLRRRWKKI